MDDVISLVATIGVAAMFTAMAIWGMVLLRKVPATVITGAIVIDEDEDLAKAGVMKPGRYHLEVDVPSHRPSVGTLTDTSVRVRYSSRPEAVKAQ